MSEGIRTALFGGTFDPLHNGHLAIAQSVIEQGLAHELWLLISPCNPWKVNQQLLDNRLRYEMAAQAVKDMPHICASDYEFNLPKPSYTANTLRHLSADYPDREFILVIGADNWVRFNNWKEADYIQQKYQTIVYPRKDCPITDVPKNITLLDCPMVDVSSTQIRNLVKEGKPIDEFVPAAVARTIKNLNLYL